MINKELNGYDYAELKKGGLWIPKAVFCVAPVGDVIYVGAKIIVIYDMCHSILSVREKLLMGKHLNE